MLSIEKTFNEKFHKPGKKHLIHKVLVIMQAYFRHLLGAVHASNAHF